MPVDDDADERWRRLGEEIAAAASDPLDSDAVAAIARAEEAQVGVLARLRASGEVAIHLPPALVLRGTVTHVGPDVALLHEGPATHAIPVAAITLVDGAVPALAWEPASAVDRIGLAGVLRNWSERRLIVHLRVGGSVSGTVARVGRDHVDVHPDEPFAGLVLARLIPFTAIAAVTDRSGLGF